MQGDFDIYGKFSTLKDGKFTMAMNVVLLAVWSPFFSDFVTEVFKFFGSCRLFARKKWEWENKSFEGVEYLCIPIIWSASNARFIFARDKFKMCGRSWKRRHVTAFSYQVPQTTSFIFTPYYFFFGNKRVLDLVFSIIFSSTGSSLAI